MASSISRRYATACVAGLAVLAAAPLRAATSATRASALLDRFAWRLLEFDPTQATTLGVDVGAHANLRRRLEDRSSAGLAARQRFLSEALRELTRLPRAGVDPVTMTSLSVAESAFRTALDGMALPLASPPSPMRRAWGLSSIPSLAR